ncbi:hypothetical protein KI387_043337, partial [Taxus chinensis]
NSSSFNRICRVYNLMELDSNVLDTWKRLQNCRHVAHHSHLRGRDGRHVRHWTKIPLYMYLCNENGEQNFNMPLFGPKSFKLSFETSAVSEPLYLRNNNLNLELENII